MCERGRGNYGYISSRRDEVTKIQINPKEYTALMLNWNH